MNFLASIMTTGIIPKVANGLVHECWDMRNCFHTSMKNGRRDVNLPVSVLLFTALVALNSCSAGSVSKGLPVSMLCFGDGSNYAQISSESNASHNEGVNSQAQHGLSVLQEVFLLMNSRWPLSTCCASPSAW